MRIFLLFIALILIISASFFKVRNDKVILPPPGINTSPQKDNQEVVASHLEVPWGISFLPGGEILLTERPGNLVMIENKQRIPISGVTQTAEGGLLGLTLHPDFSNNHYIYLYLTVSNGGDFFNRVERYTLDGKNLKNRKVIIEGIKGSENHDGGRIAFGPDKNLYISTGDAGDSSSSQDTNSLNGKILRLRDDGSVPSDNPFKNTVFAFGLRNPQGLTWDDRNRLWATDHGRSGLESGLDELNLIENGKNYGWPEIQGDEEKEGMEKAVINSGNETWAPSGAVYYDGSIFFGGLRGETLYEYKISQEALKVYFVHKFGRIRTVAVRENYLYLTTSNTDGRGDPQEDDDRLIRVDLKTFR